MSIETYAMEHSIEMLRQEYLGRLRKNQKYSLRAFAKSIGLPSGRLSEILAKKRPLSERLATQVASNLPWQPDKVRTFLEGVRKPHFGTPRESMGEHLFSKALADDEFKLIAEWHHFAILSLIKTRDFSKEPRWIARRLGISTVQVRSALERLMRLDLIREEAHTYVRTQKGITTTHDVPSSAIRQSHKHGLEQAILALETLEVGERDMSTAMFVMRREKMQRAKELIREFRRNLSSLLEDELGDEVYKLSIQFHPITVRGENHDSASS